MNKATTSRLNTAVEAYFSDLRRIRATGAGTGERSSYGPLANLLNAVGASLKPKVFCVSELADQGAGHPDFGLYEAKQVQKGRPRQGQTPERGVVEVKTPAENMGASQVRGQVVRYLNRYSLVLTTNLREFALVGRTRRVARRCSSAIVSPTPKKSFGTSWTSHAPSQTRSAQD